MPYLAAEGGRHCDFEELRFTPASDVDAVIREFFAKYPQIVGNKHYISYLMRKRVEEERDQLRQLQQQPQNQPQQPRGGEQKVFVLEGVRTFVQHDVIPAENGGREHYTYALNICLPITSATPSSKLSLPPK